MLLGGVACENSICSENGSTLKYISIHKGRGDVLIRAARAFFIGPVGTEDVMYKREQRVFRPYKEVVFCDLAAEDG